MSNPQKVGVLDSYIRATTGPRIPEKEWDHKIIPQTASRLKEKYNIKIDKKAAIIPTDKELINNLFQAGMEMLVECGVYCMDTGRVVKYTEDEVWTAIKAAPKRLVLGEGRDACVLEGRRFDDSKPPHIQGGPTGAPVAEAELEAHRGQADLFQMQASRITEHAAVEGNVVENSPAGLNVIHEGAIRDLHGLSTVIQNSGHHVVIQEATNINVTVTP